MGSVGGLQMGACKFIRFFFYWMKLKGHREGNEILESSRNEENQENATYTSSSAMMELVLRNRSAMERKKTPNYKSNSMQVKESRVQFRGFNMGLIAAQTRKGVWKNSYYEFRQKRRFFSS